MRNTRDCLRDSAARSRTLFARRRISPIGWHPIHPERFTEEYIQRECERIHDELGKDLGVGPYPR